MHVNKKLEYGYWHLIGMLTLTIRFVQGWIYWGGGSRRFIYAPQKIDPDSASYMAHKLQTAMPGALFDINVIVSFLLQHSYLLFVAIILFSLAELICGCFLILGFFTRASAMVSVLLSVSLMMLFGWQGSTCMDEWTMAASNCAMGLTLILCGASAYSFDELLTKKDPHLAHKRWFRIFASGPLNQHKLKWASFGLFLFCFVFSLGTYNHYRGAILSPYHAGPVNPRTHHVSITEVTYENGFIRFYIYVSAGAPATPIHIMKIALLNSHNTVIKEWSGASLIAWPKDKIKNTYLYNQITTDDYGLEGSLGAKAELTLPEKLELAAGKYTIAIASIDGVKDVIQFTVS